MTPADKKLRDFMVRNQFAFTQFSPEFMEEFYQLVREQVLYDTGEYLTDHSQDYRTAEANG